jgi:hypothetical protein
MCDFVAKIRNCSTSNIEYINVTESSINNVVGGICNLEAGSYFKFTHSDVEVGQTLIIYCAEFLELGINCNQIINPCTNEYYSKFTPASKDEWDLDSYCLPKYILTDCAGVYPTKETTDTAFEFYLDKVISIISETQTKVCLSIEKTICSSTTYPEFDLNSVVIVDYSTNCVECLTEKPVTEEEVKKRTVTPGYNTPGCSYEYYDKVSCKFSEAFYQEVISKRYGISFCCENDLDKWDVKKELLYLEAKKDPNICETICNTEIECNIKCINLNTCDLDILTFSALVSNGAVNFNDLLAEYQGYETSNPELYADLSFFECLFAETYCINLCYQTTSCYTEIKEDLESILNLRKYCENFAEDNYNEQVTFYEELIDVNTECIKLQAKILINIENLEAASLICQQELADLIASGADQILIDAKEAECTEIIVELEAEQIALEKTILSCGGTITELETIITNIEFNLTTLETFFNSYITQLDLLRVVLEDLIEELVANTSCDLLFPFLFNSSVSYTACNGSTILTPLRHTLKIYSQSTSDFTFVNNSGYPLDDFTTLINNIVTISDECSEIPDCANQP